MTTDPVRTAVVGKRVDSAPSALAAIGVAKSYGALSVLADLVTHDVEEALLLGHRLLRLFHRPATVLEELVLDLASPRGRSTLSDPRFVQLKADALARVLDA